MRALIVDDEKTTRETLRDFVPWSSLGFGEVDAAANGIDALARMSRSRPDVLLCDVRMPRMDGIELARRVRAEYPDCVIVFLSGYSDAEYLRGAIRVQAADYIDKPIDLGQVSAAIANAAAIAKVRSAARENEATADESARLAHLKKESLALELLSPSASASDIEARFGAVSSPFLSGAARAAVLLPRPRPGASGAERSLALGAIVASVNRDRREDFAFAACRLDADQVGLVLGPGREGTGGGALAEALEALAEEAEAWLGLGPSSRPPLVSSLAAASRSLGLRYYEPGARVLRDRADAAPPFELLAAELGRFRAAVERRDQGAAALALEELRSRAAARGDPDKGRDTAALLAFGTALVELAPGWSPTEVAAEREALKAALAEASSLEAASCLVGTLLSRCLESDSGRLSARRKTERAKDYIRGRFRDPGLSIAEIAGATGISDSYLCTLFKRECGSTVLDFITELRIEAAKALLVEGDGKIQAVAAEVGFRDAEWFSTLFKRLAGTPPGEYRERHRR